MEKNSDSSVVAQEMDRNLEASVKHLRSLLQDDHNLTIPNKCEDFLFRCLRQKDGNVQKAAKLVRAFHSAISNLGNWNAKFTPSAFKHYYPTGIVEPLLHADSAGHRIIFVRAGRWDLENVSFDQVVAILWMIVQYIPSTIPEVQRNGFIMIWDFSEFSLQHAWAVKHFKLLTLMKWAQNGIAGRVKAIHSIHHPKAVDLLYKAVKPFLKEKLKKRIFLHDSVESLLKHVGANCLPTFIGGYLDPEESIDKEIVNGFFISDQYFQDMIKDGFPCK